MYYQGLMPPHVAAGINLNMPVIGKLLRNSGGFFMRRSFGGNQLYSTVFREYMKNIQQQDTPTEYFIEGGRSRTGRLLPAKAGLLSMSTRAYLEDVKILRSRNVLPDQHFDSEDSQEPLSSQTSRRGSIWTSCAA